MINLLSSILVGVFGVFGVGVLGFNPISILWVLINFGTTEGPVLVAPPSDVDPGPVIRIVRSFIGC